MMMSFFNGTISLGETIGILITLGLALQANEMRTKNCVTKIKQLVSLLDNALKSRVVARDLSAVHAEMADRGFAFSSTMISAFEFWAKEYTLGTMREGQTAHMHFKKTVYDHLLEIVDLKPVMCSGFEYYKALNQLRVSLVEFTKSYYSTGLKFCTSDRYGTDSSYSQMKVSLDGFFNTFMNNVNDLSLFREIDLKEIGISI